jgi:hypothetical protein
MRVKETLYGTAMTCWTDCGESDRTTGNSVKLLQKLKYPAPPGAAEPVSVSNFVDLLISKQLKSSGCSWFNLNDIK